MTAETEHGYLVLADISGYTSYLAKVELEHAHDILTGLMNVIVEQFKPVLTISKLEGDAVFANVSEARIPLGERLLELIENTYFAFRRRRDASQRQTTCTCRACQSIPSLDLKFFVHHGDYIVQDISGIRELVGTDVNLVHRLMKNHISEVTGWRAYVLFTQNALEHMQLQPEGLHSQVENYEHLGDIATLTMDLHPRYEQMVSTNRVIISEEEADYRLKYEFAAPPHIVWDWLMDGSRRTRAYNGVRHWENVFLPGGRSGPGAKNHCSHDGGVMDEIILDWRPFEYVTSQRVEGSLEFRNMFIFKPLESGQGTLVEARMRLYNPRPLWLSRLITKLQFAFNNPYKTWFKGIAALLQAGQP